MQTTVKMQIILLKTKCRTVLRMPAITAQRTAQRMHLRTPIRRIRNTSYFNKDIRKGILIYIMINFVYTVFGKLIRREKKICENLN